MTGKRAKKWPRFFWLIDLVQNEQVRTVCTTLLSIATSPPQLLCKLFLPFVVVVYYKWPITAFYKLLRSRYLYLGVFLLFCILNITFFVVLHKYIVVVFDYVCC